MATYQFLDKSGTPIELDRVDREVAEWTGHPYSALEYSRPYEWLRLLGMTVALHANKSKIDEEDILDYLTDPTCAGRPDIDEEEYQTAVEFLGGGRYNFHTYG